MARMGRPVTEEPSNRKVTVRLTEAEYELLKRYVEKRNLTMTEAIKRGITLLYEIPKQ